MRSNEQLVQEALLAQLSEYQHQQQQQLDELNPFTGAAKAAGAVSGAIKGAGQKVAGTAKRATSAMGNAFKQGQTSAQKAVAGQDYKAPAAKPGSSKIMKGLQAVGRGVGAVGDLKSKVQGYDVATGTKKQQAAAAAGTTVAGMAALNRAEKAANAKAATPQAQAELKRKKDLEAQLGTTGAAATAANAAANTARATAQADNKAINKSIARNRAKGGAAPTATTVPGQKPAATGAAPTATTVPGQKPAATGTEKPAAEPAKTAQDIAAKTGADAPTKKPDLKIAGQKVKPTDPLYDKLVAMIPAETRSSIDGLSDYDKGRLKKELSA
jgi:hypothetical protein